MTLPNFFFDASAEKPLSIDLSRGTYSKVEQEPHHIDKPGWHVLASELVIAFMICMWCFFRVNVFGYGAVFTLMAGALAQPVLRGHPSAPLVHLSVLYTLFVSTQFESGVQSINPIYHLALLVYLTVFHARRRWGLIVPAALTVLVSVFLEAPYGNVTRYVLHIVNDCVFGIVLGVTCWKDKVQ